MTAPILLSVLIPSIPARLPQLTALLTSLEAQAHPQVEVLVYLDNKKRALGFKRNALIREAQGLYICNLDDDDCYSADFFASVTPRLTQDYDLVYFDADCSLNGSPAFKVNHFFGATNTHPQHLPGGRYSDITRHPWHFHCWKKEIATQAKFPEWHDGAEDAYWLRQALPLVKNHYKVDKILFHHRYSAEGSTFG